MFDMTRVDTTSVRFLCVVLMVIIITAWRSLAFPPPAPRAAANRGGKVASSGVARHDCVNCLQLLPHCHNLAASHSSVSVVSLGLNRHSRDNRSAPSEENTAQPSAPNLMTTSEAPNSCIRRAACSGSALPESRRASSCS